MAAKRSRIGDPATKAAFASRLRELMDERGLSSSETARRMRDHLPEGASVSRASLSHYRSGRAMPRLRHLEALSLALGVETSELLVPPAPESGARERAPVPALQHPETRDVPAAEAGARRPPEAMTPLGIIEDFGDEVHLRIDQRVPWDVALKILRALKAPGKPE